MMIETKMAIKTSDMAARTSTANLGAAAEQRLQHRHHEHAEHEAAEAQDDQDGDILVLQAAESDDAGHDGGGHRHAGDDIAEIAAEEAVAGFRSRCWW